MKTENDIITQMSQEGLPTSNPTKTQRIQPDNVENNLDLFNLNSSFDSKDQIRLEPMTIRVSGDVYRYVQKLSKKKALSISKVGGQILTTVIHNQPDYKKQ